MRRYRVLRTPISSMLGSSWYPRRMRHVDPSTAFVPPNQRVRARGDRRSTPTAISVLTMAGISRLSSCPWGEILCTVLWPRNRWHWRWTMVGERRPRRISVHSVDEAVAAYLVKVHDEREREGFRRSPVNKV
ncbi:hypothetical protein EJ06DRAFT_148237 [Trichodelitschia bisporula]|uniref:Uncharacterized protein n=1 Tax=Trichodelitschia bisporula TaxID=703511 RepID=A0A6G1HMW4_9PEZI|nr:hypothetical protein EJ06DRAFT_148237 [Trichodelitschia bisporula]